MDKSQEIDEIEFKKSFFYRAGWLSVFMPLVMIGVGMLLLVLSKQIDFDTTEYYCFGVFFIQGTSFMLGAASLFGIPRYGAKRILLTAIIGMAISACMWFGSLTVVGGYGLGHNC